MGYLAEFLPNPPITRSQVELMEGDSIVGPDAPGFDVLQISPRTIEDILPEILHSMGTA
jgi:NADH dehydrogenase